MWPPRRFAESRWCVLRAGCMSVELQVSGRALDTDSHECLLLIYGPVEVLLSRFRVAASGSTLTALFTAPAAGQRLNGKGAPPRDTVL
jgi:hypothetical protein